jgi:hypothetical protein
VSAIKERGKGLRNFALQNKGGREDSTALRVAKVYFFDSSRLLARRRRKRKCGVKSLGLTAERLCKLLFLRQVGVHGTLGGAVECVDIYTFQRHTDSIYYFFENFPKKLDFRSEMRCVFGF